MISRIVTVKWPQKDGVTSSDWSATTFAAVAFTAACIVLLIISLSVLFVASLLALILLGLLVSGLRTRRHEAALAVIGCRPGAGRAVTHCEDVGIPGGLQCALHHQLPFPVTFQSVEVLEQRWRTDAGGPDLECGGDEVTVLDLQSVGPHLLDR